MSNLINPMFVFQREFVQLVIDGIKKIIEMEKRLADDKSIDDLLPEGCK